jgi:hypothetical protein
LVGEQCLSNGREIEGVRLFQQAKEHGLLEANTSLGFCYQRGVGVKRNKEEAARLFKVAAEGGSCEVNLARCYEQGLGVRKNLRRALELYFKGARKLESHALKSLGYLLEKGIGIDRAVVDAICFYQLAQELGEDVSFERFAKKVRSKLHSAMMRHVGYRTSTQTKIRNPRSVQNSLPVCVPHDGRR